jgi:hypothetical protein
MLVGLSVRFESAAALTVSDAVFVVPLYVAEIETPEICAATPTVVTVKVADVFPAGTVTDCGTIAAFVFDEPSTTVKPTVGALAVSVTVPVTVLPPRRPTRRSRLMSCLGSVRNLFASEQFSHSRTFGRPFAVAEISSARTRARFLMCFHTKGPY